MRQATCDLCEIPLADREPRYPVRLDGEQVDVMVCVKCALHLASEGLGAWPTGR
jgi:hypothetical protein